MELKRRNPLELLQLAHFQSESVPLIGDVVILGFGADKPTSGLEIHRLLVAEF